MGRTTRTIERCIYRTVIFIDCCFSCLLRVLGPILVVAANGLVGLVTWVYLTQLWPRYLKPRCGPIGGGAVVCIGLYLLFNILWNYWCCVLTRPGFPGHHQQALEDLEQGERPSTAGRVRFCKKCHVPKPERVHHCSVCNRCVMKMDHHCPWVNNCVGFYNYRFFVLFLLHLAAGCVLVATTCLLPLFRGRINKPSENLVLFVFVLCLSVLFALSLFVGWHAYLCATNQTTIEFYSNRFDAYDAKERGERWSNPYDLGWRANLEQVFGMNRHVFAWLLPSLRLPPGDGMQFPTRAHDGSLGELHHV